MAYTIQGCYYGGRVAKELMETCGWWEKLARWRGPYIIATNECIKVLRKWGKICLCKCLVHCGAHLC